ncbi:Pup-like protein [Bifidobacterium anseris]|uniref:Prokaryotic ubiquitin-like protein Pup n=1 Tax=Bifidobacterium anseris TaxID=2020963 RepID=A0A2N5J2Q3_9BIFI|nr:ubiquitin-like protein Pup [Bifidobacterium anseris]PLS28477.1 Pup-like protein [Bifidobacterium anseris]
MPQEQRNTAHTHDDQTAAADAALRTQETGAYAAIDDLDAILDDIEEVLETNAEEYVNGFVQKGGQ